MSNTASIKAMKIGVISVFSYIACYYMRHLLGVATPMMVDSGLFTKEFLGIVSSFYLLAYAIGQLVNGVIGDKKNPKYMVSCGLIVSDLAFISFALINSGFMQLLCFLILGFSMSIKKII